MANRGSFCTLARNMSFEEEPDICVQAADAAGGPPPAAPPPPPEPCFALHAWLQQLGASAAVEMHPNFDSMVAAEEAEQRRACAASRGGVGCSQSCCFLLASSRQRGGGQDESNPTTCVPLHAQAG